MSELKPCPFCGGKAEYTTNGKAYWVTCWGCGARSRITYFDGDKGKQIVTDAWNRRQNERTGTDKEIP